MSSNYTVFTGVWTSHDTGYHILTLSGRGSVLLQSAIPVFVSLVGPLTWIFVKYPWYLCSGSRSYSSGPAPFLRRQKLVLLRNSVGDLGTALDAVAVAWRWRRVGVGPSFGRLLPLIFISFGFFWTWQVTAVLTGFIWQWSSPTVVQVRSPVCGINSLLGPVDFTQDAEVPFVKLGLSQTILAETYASQCYGNNNSPACSIYANQSLSYDSWDTVCPFLSDDFCLYTNSTPYLLSSGQIDSFGGLGINAPPKNRVTYQKNTTCSPMHSTQFGQVVWANTTDEKALWPQDTLLHQFFYGPIDQSNVSYTFEYSEWAPSDGNSYDITGETYNPGTPSQNLSYGWTPNTTWINRTDVDITVLFQTPNHAINIAPVYDPFFLAANTSYSQTINGQTTNYWTPDFYVYTMGCIEQHQLCNPSLDPSIGCTPFMAYNQLNDSINIIGYNAAQLATARRIISVLSLSNIYGSINGRRGAALLASQSVDGVTQTAILPNDQWRTEVSNWFAISLAKLQQAIVDFAGGPSDPDLLPYIQAPADAETKSMCSSQLVQIPVNFNNFNLTAIIIVVALGSFIIIVCYEAVASFIIAKCTPCLSHGNQKRAWTEDEPFHLQRLYYTKLGMQHWEQDVNEDIPLNITDPLPDVLIHMDNLAGQPRVAGHSNAAQPVGNAAGSGGHSINPTQPSLNSPPLNTPAGNAAGASRHSANSNRPPPNTPLPHTPVGNVVGAGALPINSTQPPSNTPFPNTPTGNVADSSGGHSITSTPPSSTTPLPNTRTRRA